MSQKTFNNTIGLIFVIIGAIHLVRSILGWPVFIGTVSIPVGVSVVAFLLSAFFAYTAFKLNKAK
jgi:hypothetical protein